MFLIFFSSSFCVAHVPSLQLHNGITAFLHMDFCVAEPVWPRDTSDRREWATCDFIQIGHGTTSSCVRHTNFVFYSANHLNIKKPKNMLLSQLSVCDRCLIVHSAVGQSIGCARVSRVNLIQQTIIIGTSCLRASSLLPELMHQHYAHVKIITFSYMTIIIIRTMHTCSRRWYCVLRVSLGILVQTIGRFNWFIQSSHRLCGHFKIF